MAEDVGDLPRGQPGLIEQGGDGLAEGPEGHPARTRPAALNGFHARLRTLVASRMVPVQLGKIGPARLVAEPA